MALKIRIIEEKESMPSSNLRNIRGAVRFRTGKLSSTPSAVIGITIREFFMIAEVSIPFFHWI